METDAHFQSLTWHILRVPSKGALPLGSSRRPPLDRDASFLEPSFIHLSKSPVPHRGPYGERYPSPEPSFTHPPGSPVKETPPPHKGPTEKESVLLEPPSQNYEKKKSFSLSTPWHFILRTYFILLTYFLSYRATKLSLIFEECFSFPQTSLNFFGHR